MWPTPAIGWPNIGRPVHGNDGTFATKPRTWRGFLLPGVMLAVGVATPTLTPTTVMAKCNNKRRLYRAISQLGALGYVVLLVWGLQPPQGWGCFGLGPTAESGVLGAPHSAWGAWGGISYYKAV